MLVILKDKVRNFPAFEISEIVHSSGSLCGTKSNVNSSIDGVCLFLLGMTLLIICIYPIHCDFYWAPYHGA